MHSNRPASTRPGGVAPSSSSHPPVDQFVRCSSESTCAPVTEASVAALASVEALSEAEAGSGVDNANVTMSVWKGSEDTGCAAGRSGELLRRQQGVVQDAVVAGTGFHIPAAQPFRHD